MALLHKLATNKNESDDDINSIIENLNNILNTKCGYGFFLQDFGISDYHHLNSGADITETIIKEISDNIKRFEPRIELLKIVDVTVCILMVLTAKKVLLSLMKKPPIRYLRR